MRWRSWGSQADCGHSRNFVQVHEEFQGCGAGCAIFDVGHLHRDPFFEFYLKDIWGVGCFGRVLSFCVETRRCLILKQKEIGLGTSWATPSNTPASCRYLTLLAPLYDHQPLALLHQPEVPMDSRFPASPACQGPEKQRAQEIRQFFPST